MIGYGLVQNIQDHLSALTYDQLFIVYDRNLPVPVIQETVDRLRPHTPHVLGLSASEEDKNWFTVQTLLDAFHEALLSRHCLILVIGGGVIGDVVGFAASIYKRGVSWAFIPTTLVAQIDSSIGGKTSINTDYGKNQIGTFHCPKLVIADTDLVRFLSGRHLQAGMAEIIKIAAMMDPSLIDRLHHFDLFTISEMGDIFAHAAQLKIAVINDDPWEEKTLGRTRLNFGHTLGHAVESYYHPQIIHGEAIAVGMLSEINMAQELGHTIFKQEWVESFTELVVKFIPEHILYPLPPKEELYPYLQHDKKNTSTGIPFIIPHPTEQAQRVILPFSTMTA